jgi:hypothetical protein
MFTNPSLKPQLCWLSNHVYCRKQEVEDTPGELSAVVDELLDGLTAKFSTVSAEIFARSKC